MEFSSLRGNRETLAQRHLGIIVKAAYQHWKRLPPHIAVVISLDDLISDVVAHVLAVSKNYKKRLGAESTFVAHVAHNRCHTIVSYHTMVRKRQGIMVSESALLARWRPDATLRFTESKNSVERLLESASNELQQYLSDFMETRHYRAPSPALREEARVLARRYGVTYQDLHTVLRCL